MEEIQTIQILDKDEERITSLQIAEVTGKKHKDVLKAIRNMESAWEKVQGQWILYGKYLSGGYVHTKKVDIVRSNGCHDVKNNTEWTTKGQLFIYVTLKAHGILPLIERSQEPKEQSLWKEKS